MNNLQKYLFFILNHFRLHKNVYEILLLNSVWSIGSLFALFFRYEYAIPISILKNFILALPWIIVLVNLFNFLDKLIFGESTKKLFGELESTVRKFFIMSLGISLILLISPKFILPKSFAVLTSGISLILYMVLKSFSQSLYFKLKLAHGIKPIAIYGGGLQGQLLLRKIAENPAAMWKPIVIIDDHIKNKKMHGIKIVNGRNLGLILKKFYPDILIITFSSIDAEKLEYTQGVCSKLGIELRIIPPILALTKKDFEINDIRIPTLEELIGKKSIVIDTDTLKSIYTDKIILITGAGGSIGSEIARQIFNFKPKNLYLLDRDESALLETALSLDIDSAFEQQNLILADIRDSMRINEIFCTLKPEIVIHAAALKHLQMLEDNHHEAFKTNVIGTKNILRAAVDNQVEVFINISTDKASDPISVLGKSKLISEKLTTKAGLSTSLPTSTKYLSVRFGNVFGSRGSVLFTFQRQIDSGGPITITQKGIKRYFMTIEEAVHLVLKAAKFGSTGETLILKMGNPIEIEEIAKKLIEHNKKLIDIKYLKLRKGEKIIEQLIGKNEEIREVIEDSIIKIFSSPIDQELNIENWQSFT